MVRKLVEKVNVTRQIIHIIDELVKKGLYVSRDEFVRESCRHMIREYLKTKVIMYVEKHTI